MLYYEIDNVKIFIPNFSNITSLDKIVLKPINLWDKFYILSRHKPLMMRLIKLQGHEYYRIGGRLTASARRISDMEFLRLMIFEKYQKIYYLK